MSFKVLGTLWIFRNFSISFTRIFDSPYDKWSNTDKGVYLDWNFPEKYSQINYLTTSIYVSFLNSLHIISAKICFVLSETGI
jgi:hypothetical protein